jgi:hypothetical protein
MAELMLHQKLARSKPPLHWQRQRNVAAFVRGPLAFGCETCSRQPVHS